MKRKLLYNCVLFLLFFFSSCTSEENNIEKEVQKTEIHSKSIWNENGKFIAEVNKYFEDYLFRTNLSKEDFNRNYGEPNWNYALTFGENLSDFIVIPTFKNGKIYGALKAERKGKKVKYSFSLDNSIIDLFSKIVYTKPDKIKGGESKNLSVASRYEYQCETRWVGMWYPENEGGYWSYTYYDSCSWNWVSDTPAIEYDLPTDWDGGGGSGSGSGTIVITGPDIKITNVADFLKCINKAQGATLTVYAAQPQPNNSVAYNGTYVGHAFISLSQGGQTKVIGYYPISNNIYPLINPSGKSVYGNDTSHGYNVSYSKNISSAQLSSIVNYINSKDGSTYHLDNYNCTDFAIEVGNLGGMNLPDSYGTWPQGGGSNPGALGQHLRTLSGNKNSMGNLYAPSSTNCQ